MEAVTPDGRLVKRMISIGGYKTMPNNVNTSTGETIYFTPPEQVKPAMTDLIDWYRSKEREGEHPSSSQPPSTIVSFASIPSTMETDAWPGCC